MKSQTALRTLRRDLNGTSSHQTVAASSQLPMRMTSTAGLWYHAPLNPSERVFCFLPAYWLPQESLRGRHQ